MDTISRQVADALASRKIPWRMPNLPRNELSDSAYGGVAPILLTMRGFSSPFWGTRFDWKAVRSRIIVAPEDGICLPGEDDAVFNLEQTDGTYQARTLAYRSPGPFFDALIVKAGITIEWQIDATCDCDRSKDLIRIPCPWMFIEVDGFFHALSHEIFHFSERYTGWKSGNVADDELRAEIGAAHLGAAIGLNPLDMRFRLNHDKYVKTWVASMRADPELLFRVCNSVTTAIPWLLKFVGMEMNWHITPESTAALSVTYPNAAPMGMMNPRRIETENAR
jgi:hypothetical protein